jgi:hypothetical protein
MVFLSPSNAMKPELQSNYSRSYHNPARSLIKQCFVKYIIT